MHLAIATERLAAVIYRDDSNPSGWSDDPTPGS